MLKKLNSAKYFSITLLLLAFSLFGCKNTAPDEDIKHPSDQITHKVNRTVIMYMVADNNLYNSLIGDIDEMESAMQNSMDGRLLVYLYPVNRDEFPAGKPKLLWVRHNSTPNKIEAQVLKEYPRSQNPLDPLQMSSIISDAMAMSPSNSYALGFSSHATGWLPQDQPLRVAPQSQMEALQNPLFGVSLPQTRTFGQIYTHADQMEIKNMGKIGLPQGTKFDFILFDACLMGGIEVCYELRNNANYIISSSAEILADGFPYTSAIKHMFAYQADVEAIAREYADHYNAKSGLYQSATISVVRTNQLKNLAATTKQIINSMPLPAQINTNDIFMFTGNLYAPLWFDFEDYMTKTWGESSEFYKLSEALNAAIVFKDCTPNYFGIPIESHCGVTSYIPQSKYSIANQQYANDYEWSKDSGLDAIAHPFLNDQPEQ